MPNGFLDRLMAKQLDVPPTPTLTEERKRDEAASYWRRAETMTDDGRVLLLAAMLQRIYAEGVLAGHDRAVELMKRFR